MHGTGVDSLSEYVLFEVQIVTYYQKYRILNKRLVDLFPRIIMLAISAKEVFLPIPRCDLKMDIDLVQLCKVSRFRFLS